MFILLAMNLDNVDTMSIEKQLFITFRKHLKKLLRDEYHTIFGEVCDEPLSRNIMLSLKDFAHFDGEMAKQHRITNPTECADMIANTAFTMFQILCTLQHEYRVKKHMKRLTGIISDPGRGYTAMERIVFALNTMYDIASKHEIFDIVQEDIARIDTFMERTFGCEIGFD